jgi:hypothetical protein
MQISLKAPEVIEISGDNGSALVTFGSATKVAPEEGQLVFGRQIEETKTIDGPGEYEFGHVSLVALETKAERVGKSELFEVGVDGVNTLFITENPGEITKDHWDAMGEIDILVLSLKSDVADMDKLIKKIVPYVVIVISGDKEAAEKATELTVESIEKKVKYTDKDFTAEDPVTKLILLDK